MLAQWNGLSGTTELLLFLGFMIAFAIKAPLFPFHTWLPLVHTEAPTAGSVVLAGVIIKMGAYGFIRFSFELFPQASVDMAPIMMILAVIGIIYGAIVAAMQTDLKRIIAYSSVAHMGFVVLGIFSLSVIGLDGAVFTMVSHPLTTGALFLVVGFLYERRHTREISAFRGVWKVTPVLGGLFLTALFAGIGLPGFSGFIGEFLSLLGAFVWDRPYAIVATFGVILAAVYTLWAFQRVFTGKPSGENIGMKDVSFRELVVVVPLLAAEPVPRPLPEAGARPHPAHGRAAGAQPRAQERLPPARTAVDRQGDPEDRPGDRRRHGLGRRPGEAGAGQVSFAAVAPITPPSVDWLAIAPELALGGAAVLVVLAKALLRRRPVATPVSYVIAAIGIITCGAMLFWQWQDVKDHTPIVTMSEMVRVDTFGVFLGVVVLAATAMSLLVAIGYLRREQLEVAEYVSLMLFSATGMLVMTTANDLIVVFLALEILSIPLYVLAAYHRRRLSSQEAGIKYFVLGAFSSAIFLYGIALVYGGTGSTSLTGIDTFLRANTLFQPGTLQAGIVLLLVGLGFKVAAVPFHMWTPDVYQGAPTPVTAFMASATKVAAFAALLRIFDGAFLTYRDQWQPVVWGLTVLTLIVGSIGALLQVDLKRLLAYSSIAHAGYLLMAVETGTPKGREAALFYLFAYTFMVIGSFSVVTVLSKQGDEDHPIDGLRGLASRRPVIGSLLVLFMLAQAGIPLTSGFVAKLDVFSAAASAGDYILVVVGAVATVIASFAYLRVALAVSTPSSDGEATERVRHRRVDTGTWIVLAICAGVTIVLGHRPGGVRALGPGRDAPHARHHLDPLDVDLPIVRLFARAVGTSRQCRSSTSARRRGATSGGGVGDGGCGRSRRRRARRWRAHRPTP